MKIIVIDLYGDGESLFFFKKEPNLVEAAHEYAIGHNAELELDDTTAEEKRLMAEIEGCGAAGFSGFMKNRGFKEIKSLTIKLGCVYIPKGPH
jgi:hypothetical protein